MEILINEITKLYGRNIRALDRINLKLGKGMFGLLGPNGAGKTTLMRILSTLLLPTNGEVYFDQYSLSKNPKEMRERLGYLPQNFHPYPKLTVKEFLTYMSLLSDGDYSNETIDKCLEMVNLLEQKDIKTSQLSGGMNRRLGIAQALINDPELLIVDEPTSGLDPVERIRFRNLLSGLSASRTVILSTHIVEDVASTCSDLAVLNQGKIIF